MKIAIVCDWLITYAGSERVLAEFLNCFPEADVFAVVDFVPSEQRHFLKNKTIKTTFIQRLPGAKKHYRSYLPLMPLAIEQLDVSEYDVIISGSHAVAKGILTGPDQIHISYTYSPMRYAWDLQHQYLAETGMDTSIKGYLAKYFLHKLRLWDYRTANGVDHFVTSSNYIARRIWKTYRRQAHVIAPPVDTSFYTPHADKENFYLAASRLVPYKKMDLIVESFATMPNKKLIIIGDGPDMEKVKSKAASNIEILGFQPAEKLKYYMQRAKAFIFAAEEDFGIVPLEAQACGTPVIAYGKGGALETIRGLDKAAPTGLFFAEQSVQSICQAVSEFEANTQVFTLDNCVENASRFSPQIFRDKFTAYVREKIAATKATINHMAEV
jgi:glycosyltransferase involved in cell wall biosynthesis